MSNASGGLGASARAFGAYSQAKRFAGFQPGREMARLPPSWSADGGPTNSQPKGPPRYDSSTSGNLVEAVSAAPVANQLPVHGQLAPVDLLQMVDAAQEGALAGPRGSDEAEDLPRIRSEEHTSEL